MQTSSENDVLDGIEHSSDPIEDVEATEVIYDWDLVSDGITWGSNLGSVLGVADVEGLSTGLGYAEHLVAESPSSRYEAIMAPGGCDTGGGVSFKVVYGLAPEKRSKAPPIWIEDCGRWFADAADRPGRAHGVIRVVTKRFEVERQLAAATQKDVVSGAYTRAFFIEHVARQLSLAARKVSTFAVILIGLDPQQEDGVIDDAVVADAVERLQADMRSHEVLARYTDTKLAALLEGCNREQAAAAAERLIATIGSSAASARIGAVIAPCHGASPQALLQFAEEALEVTRQPAGPKFVSYRPGLARTEVRPPMQPSDEILSALNEGRVVLALQSIVNAKTRAIAFYEGLVRIRRADGTVMMPNIMVAAAEKAGLVPLIDRRVIELAFALLTADRKLFLSINASVTSLQDPSWFDHLRVCSKLRPDAARRLIVEITETCVVSDLEATQSVLRAIKGLGTRVAIDDFGSGHSSFRNLRLLPVDFLKIDGAFAQNLANSQDDRFFIRTLIDLARNLQIPTVAEWVEDEATAALLAEWGVQYLQGHHFGRAELTPEISISSRPTNVRAS